MTKIQNRSLEVILKGIDGKEYIYRVELNPKEINYHDYDYAIDRAKDFHIKNVGQLLQIKEGDEPIAEGLDKLDVTTWSGGGDLARGTTDMRTIDQTVRPGGQTTTSASFIVESGKIGAQRV